MIYFLYKKFLYTDKYHHIQHYNSNQHYYITVENKFSKNALYVIASVWNSICFAFIFAYAETDSTHIFRKIHISSVVIPRYSNYNEYCNKILYIEPYLYICFI